MSQENHFAILVGISRYADSNLHSLDGPVRDVRLIHDWLVAPGGGNVPENNITTIISDETSQTPADGDMPPVFEDFFAAFLRLVRKPDKSGYIRRESGRLYLYFSGHGFSEKQRREAHAALYVANADRDVNWNIYGTYFAQWTKDQGLFDEIVLIMDCCRDAELAKQPLVPPLRRPTDVGTGLKAKLFEVYAAPRGGKAQERPIAARNNEVHGLLTHAFFDAVQNAAPGQPAVSSQAIKDYLRERWSALCGAEPSDPPELVVPTNGEILFSRGAEADLSQGFTIESLTDGSVFEIVNGSLTTVARISIEGSTAHVERINGATTSCPILDHVLTVTLPAGLYMALALLAGSVIKRTFQAGDHNVQL
jgi:hypothetical protein